MKFQMRRLAKKLQPLVREKQKAKRIGAATLIQRMFRRYKDRKQQLEKLKIQNEMKRMREEEEEQLQEDMKKKKQAGRVIIRHWRAYKGKKQVDMEFAINSIKSKELGKSKTIYFPTVRKC